MPSPVRRFVSLVTARPDASIFAALVTALVVGFALVPVCDGFSLRALAIVAVLVSGVCLTLVARASSGGVWSVPLVCLLALTIFHLGALPEFLYRDTASQDFIERFI